jgi:hypothetical protein
LPIRDGFAATVDCMEEAVAVLERLERIERLQRDGASSEALLEELRALLREADDWARVEGGDAAEDAVARLRSALTRDLVVA